MRVIAGNARGRKLKTFRGRNIRPTPDRVRESLFNSLAAQVVGSHFLDLCAGTGSVGLEALSRGAQRVVWVEKTRNACRLIAENLHRSGLASVDHLILQRDVLQAIPLLERRGEAFHLIFLDPPFRSSLADQILHSLASSTLIVSTGFVIAEHSSHTDLASEYEGLCRIRRRVFGEVVLSFYQPKDTLEKSVES